MLCFGVTLYLLGVLLVFPRYLLGLNTALMPLNEAIVWYSGAPVLAGILLSLLDLLVLFPFKRYAGPVRNDVLRDHMVTVALTAFNDEASIGLAVQDFKCHPRVKNVIVISNNSSDRTIESCCRGRGFRLQRTRARLWAVRLRR